MKFYGRESMNKREDKELKDLIEKGMRAVHKKLRQDKIKLKEPLVVSDNEGNVILLDPKTMKKIAPKNP